ncbi:MAG: 50S ribosomal protein L6 [Deltaproteobacteria bacterium]|nr:MAG: 50S ribosomal protein L6 [Deltaproteobacteria bacterium]
MSRIGKKPVAIPSGVEVKLEGRKVMVKGPKGSLEYQLLPEVDVEVADGFVKVTRKRDDRTGRTRHGLTRALIANMITGVEKGYQRVLLISGVGYRADKSGNKLVLQLGFSHKVEMGIPPGIEVDLPAADRIVVKGIRKELVGQFAAKIRALRPADPYKAKGVTYEGERIIRKAGKKAVG